MESARSVIASLPPGDFLAFIEIKDVYLIFLCYISVLSVFFCGHATLPVYVLSFWVVCCISDTGSSALLIVNSRGEILGLPPSVGTVGTGPVSQCSADPLNPAEVWVDIETSEIRSGTDSCS